MRMNKLYIGILASLTAASSFAAEDSSENHTMDDIEVIEKAENNVSSVKLLPETALGLKDTSEVLKQIPGANVNRNGPLTGIAQYRGMYSTRVNIDFDGFHMKEAGPNAMDTSMSHLPTSLVSAISLHRGVTPVSDGIETIGGSISVIPKGFSSAEDAFAAEIGFGYNSVDDGRNVSLFLTSNQSNHKFYLGADVLKGNSFDFDGGTNYFTGYDRNMYVMGYGFDAGSQDFSIELNYNDTGETGTPSLPMDIIYVRGGDVKLNHSIELSDAWSLSSKYSFQDTEHIMNNFRFRNTMMYREAFTQVHAQTYGITAEKETDGGSFVIGLEGDFSSHQAIINDPTNANFRIQNFDAQRDRHSLFAESEMTLSEDLKMTAGARYTRVTTDSKDVSSSVAMMDSMMGMMHRTLRDRFNQADKKQTDHNLDTALNLRHTISPNLDFSYSVGYKTRSPSYQERYLWLPMEATAGMADGNQYFGNIDLKPEHSKQIDIGLDYHANGFSVAPHVFYYQVDDYIQGTPTTSMPAPPGTLTFNNVDAKFYGADIESSYEFSDQWILTNTTSYVRGQRRDIDDNIYRVAPANTRFQLTYNKNAWSTSAEMIAYQDQEKVSVTNNEERTGGYGLMNLKTLFELNSNSTIVVGVNNIFDREYKHHLNGYNRNSLNTDVGFDATNLQGYRLPGEGRSYYVNLFFSW
jgi:iron complex outermembrane receptor protein